MSVYLGEIRPFTGPVPSGWIECDGRQLKISQNQPLYSLVGTRYGGDGSVLFNLPDLRGRVTAGVDAERNQGLGDTSGAPGDHATAIPFEVVNWAIAVQGVFPNPD